MSAAPPAAAPTPAAGGRDGVLVWLAVIALLASGAIALVRVRGERAAVPPPRPAQGRLLAGLLRSRELSEFKELNELKLKDHATR